MWSFILKQFGIGKLKVWLGREVVRRIRRRYSLGEQYTQTFSKSHTVDWEEINKFARISSVIYKDADTIRNTLPRFVEASLLTYTKIYIHEINKIQYMLITSDDAKEYIISVRGTNNIKNAFLDLKFFKDKSKRLMCKVHKGFHSVAEDIFSDLRPRMSNPEYSIYVTGHSLGGAEALLIGAYCDHAKMNLKKIITFGQPKVFDSVGVEKWKHLPLTRVVNETDIVPLVPPVELLYMFSRYKHFGDMIKLCNEEYYCYLENHQAQGFGVNSFWLNAANEGFSIKEIFKEVPDHYMDHYIDGIMPKLGSGGREILWKEREEHMNNP